jgi:hypothetical protein
MSPRRVPDFAQLARAVSLREFLTEAPKYFLLGTVRLVRPVMPSKTLSARSFAALRKLDTESAEATLDPSAPVEEPPSQLVPLAIWKVQDLFPEMVTVGRASNNDVIIDDVSVSKFHAYFKLEEQILLVDADSSNGTRVGGKLVAPKVATPLEEGVRVSFASLAYTFVNAATCWDELRRHRTHR